MGNTPKLPKYKTKKMGGIVERLMSGITFPEEENTLDVCIGLPKYICR